ncbi:hypothetical protein AA12467_0488 [Gluconobacter sphaericus NBRC 12467]|nr:hypothetical protein AA12467_0488 [Gluconobacter sphaericus NBRC 12467]
MTVFEHGGHIDETAEHERDRAKVEHAVIADGTCGLRAHRLTRMRTHTVFCEMDEHVFGAMADDGEFRASVGVDHSASGGREGNAVASGHGSVDGFGSGGGGHFAWCSCKLGSFGSFKAMTAGGNSGDPFAMVCVDIIAIR